MPEWMKIRSPKFDIGTRVYHVTQESDQGVIINAHYTMRHGYWIYEVSFKPGISCDLFEDEISENKYF